MSDRGRNTAALLRLIAEWPGHHLAESATKDYDLAVWLHNHGVKAPAGSECDHDMASLAWATDGVITCYCRRCGAVEVAA